MKKRMLKKLAIIVAPIVWRKIQQRRRGGHQGGHHHGGHHHGHHHGYGRKRSWL